jgi:integrase
MSAHDRWPPATTITGCSPNRAADDESKPICAADDEGKPICPPQLMDALILASLTGLRLGDLVRLDWANVGDQAIVLTTRKRKGRAVIPILPDLRAHLDARAHRTGPVLRNSRGRPGPKAASARYSSAASPRPSTARSTTCAAPT